MAVSDFLDLANLIDLFWHVIGRPDVKKAGHKAGRAVRGFMIESSPTQPESSASRFIAAVFLGILTLLAIGLFVLFIYMMIRVFK